MRAVTISRFGGPDVLTTVDLPTPEPGPGQVSIDVTHAAVGLADVLMRRGEFGGEPPIIPGLEVAGTVRAVGDGVTDLRVGQPVVTLSRPTAGGYAEVSIADAGVTISLDDTPDLDPAAAVAALPNATTAILALTTVAHLQPGERLLVHGALGSLSTSIAQVARHLHAGKITGTVRRAEQMDAARERGDDVLLADDFTEHADAHPADVIVDPVGGPLREASLHALAPLGRLLCVGNASGTDDVSFGGNQLWLANAAVLGLNAGGLLADHPERGRDAARRALDLLTSGALTTDYTTMPLDQAAQAHQHLEQGGVTERLVLTV
jgi:NADPH2:quinone reductase